MKRRENGAPSAPSSIGTLAEHTRTHTLNTHVHTCTLGTRGTHGKHAAQRRVLCCGTARRLAAARTRCTHTHLPAKRADGNGRSQPGSAATRCRPSSAAASAASTSPLQRHGQRHQSLAEWQRKHTERQCLSRLPADLNHALRCCCEQLPLAPAGAVALSDGPDRAAEGDVAAHRARRLKVGPEDHKDRRCLSHENSGNTRQRQCLYVAIGVQAAG